MAKMEDVIAAEYEANRRLAEDGILCVNSWYDLLGICHIERGDELGWDVGELSDYFGICWLDFGNVEHVEKDGTKWYSIHYSYDPCIDGIIDPDVDWNAIKDMINRSGQNILPEQM